MRLKPKRGEVSWVLERLGRVVIVGAEVMLVVL